MAVLQLVRVYGIKSFQIIIYVIKILAYIAVEILPPIASVSAIIVTYYIGFFGDNYYSHYERHSIGLLVVVIFLVAYLILRIEQTARSQGNRSLVYIVILALLIPSILISFAVLFASNDGAIAQECVNAESNGLIVKNPEVFGNRDYFYFSIVTFSTLGYGDIAPVGNMRTAAGLEAALGTIITPILLVLVLKRIFR